MGDVDNEINDLLSRNLLVISETLQKQNSEVLKHLGQVSKRFDDNYKNFINESIKSVSKNLEVQSFKFVGQIWQYLFKSVSMKQSIIEKQQMEQKKEEEKIKIEETNSSKYLYETATVNLKEFLKSKKVQDYVFSVCPPPAFPQNVNMNATNNDPFMNTAFDKSTFQKQIKDEQQEEGFYSGMTSKRSSVAMTESFMFQPDATSFSFKSQFNQSQLLMMNQKKVGADDGDKEKILIVKQKVKLVDESSAAQIQSLKKELEFANRKVQDMQQQLLDITTGYIRDVNHFKDLALGNLKLSAADFFEVKYFDSTVILDEKLRILLNDKLDDMKRQCEKKFQEVYFKYKVASNELEKLTKSLNSFLENNTYFHHLKTAFQQQQNPYMIWKAIQDIKGLSFLFEIIENQKPQYGIKYTEIDKFISKSSAANRQFQTFQNIIEQRYSEICQNYNTLANESDLSIQKSLENCTENDKFLENSIQECLKSKEETISKQIEQRLYEEYDEKRMKLYEEFKFDDSTVRRMEALEKKLAFQKWRFCIQLMMRKQVTKKNLVNLLNFKDKLKNNQSNTNEDDDESAEYNDANQERREKDWENQQEQVRYEWSYEKELEKKEISIQELKDINKILSRKISYLYEQLQKVSQDRQNIQREKIILDGKISLLKLAFKEICKAVKYEYNLQINETQFKSLETEYRAKQFLRDIQNASSETQGLIQMKIDSTGRAVSVLESAKQNSSFANGSKTYSQAVQTHIQCVDLPLSQLEQEFNNQENDFKEIKVANEIYTEQQLQNYKMLSNLDDKDSSIKLMKDTIEVGIQVDLGSKTNKKTSATIADGGYKKFNAKSPDKSQNSSSDDEYEQDYMTAKRIQNRTLEKSSVNRSSLSPHSNVPISKTQNSKSPQLQLTQQEKGVFNRLWNEGNKKKVRLEKLKQDQFKKDSEIWQEMINYTSFAQTSNNLSQQNQGSNQSNNSQIYQDNNERLKTDQSHIRLLQKLNNSGILNDKMLQLGNTEIQSQIQMYSNFGGTSMILDNDYPGMVKDNSQRRYASKSPINHNKPTTPFMIGQQQQQRSQYQTLKNSQNNSNFKTDAERHFLKHDSHIRYFNEENDKSQTILQPLHLKANPKEQREQRSQSNIGTHEKKQQEGNKLYKVNHNRSIISDLKTITHAPSKDKNERMVMNHDGSIQFLPLQEATSSKSPQMNSMNSMNATYYSNAQKRRQIPLKSFAPSSHKNISLDVSSLKLDFQNPSKYS